jgi:O-antigen ligase
MLSRSLEAIRREWPSRWPELLLMLYCFLYFLPNVTRYKGLILIILLVGAIGALWRGQASMRPLWRQSLLWALVVVSLAVVYSSFVSPDSVLSLRTARKPVFIDGLLVGMLWAIVLQQTPHERVARSLIGGFTGGLLVLLVLDGFGYYQDYMVKGLPFGTNFDHRELSYGLLVCLPFAMVFLRHVRGALKYFAMLLVALLIASLIGTLARGAWLAALVVLVIWVLHYGYWKQSLIVVLAAATFALSWIALQPETALARKLQQTDSNLRWNGGVQSAAIDLILESPWQGYGFGDEIYARVYNERVSDHPEWTVRASMGPHNMVLRMWFGCGIAGLLAILTLYLAICRTSWRLLRETSGIVHDAIFAVLLVFVGAIFVRGLFESAYMNHLGWISAMLMTFSMAPRTRPAHQP